MAHYFNLIRLGLYQISESEDISGEKFKQIIKCKNMKAFLSIVMNCIMITLLIQCRAVKSTTQLKTKEEKGGNQQIQAKHESNALRQDTFFLYCDDLSGYLDNKRKSIIAYNNSMLDYCLREKAFLGDTASLRQIAELITLMNYPFETFNQKLRGEKIFKVVLEKLNNFEFVPGPNGEMDVFTYYGSYARIMYQMIESIDGVSPDIYLPNNYPKRFATELSGIEPFSPEYIQKSGRIKWEIFKESYEKGLIKFKAFGQE